MPDARLTASVRGRVQGVGFRAWVRREARALGLVGSATNLPDGGVEVVVQGRREDCAALLAALRGPAAPGRVAAVGERWGDPRPGLDGFSMG